MKKENYVEIFESTVEDLFKEEIKEVRFDTVKVGDEVYISDTNMTPYKVLDIGEPFILILDTKTNFAHLYKCGSVLYKNKYNI